MKDLPYTPKAVIGHLEMVTLPSIGMSLCAKVDTGAYTSALHAEEIEIFEEEGLLWISFITRSGGQESPPHHYRTHLHDRRHVTSSNGQKEWRYVIRLLMQLGQLEEMIEVTLTDRSDMRYPMLLGRRALRRLLVAPGVRYLHGEP